MGINGHEIERSERQFWFPRNQIDEKCTRKPEIPEKSKPETENR